MWVVSVKEARKSTRCLRIMELPFPDIMITLEVIIKAW
jgi:hypothetical protein